MINNSTSSYLTDAFYSKKMLKHALRTSLHAFIQRSFTTLNNGETFDDNWHIEAICHHLALCMEGKCKRLLITLPPRNLKSHISTISWPAFILGQNPSAKIICASYSQSLSETLFSKARILLGSDWYRELFPKTIVGDKKDTASEVVTSLLGNILATSVGGTLTGIGADFLILDDLQKADEAHSKTKRASVINWFRNTVTSRLNNKAEGVIVVIQQRLHEDDLPGYLIKTGNWTHLNLAAIAQQDETIALSDTRSHHRKEGELLHPSRENMQTIMALKADMGSSIFSAQYLQSPVPIQGGFINIAKFKTYDAQPIKLRQNLIIQSWDTAIATGANNDYSVCTTWLYRPNEYFLLHVCRERLSYSDLRTQAHELALTHSPDLILIESSANGFALAQDLQLFTNFTTLELSARGDKVDRMSPGTADIDGGKVYIPEDAGWRPIFLQECAAFPEAGHDDQVDSMSQFLHWARRKGKQSRSDKKVITVARALVEEQQNPKYPKNKEQLTRFIQNRM